ncbi:DUF2184 domain-containing protein [Candidatus Dependentiae bacterium]|nr:MAG: DUF2184 domain-containing protein [Candidatus Dependentiae bacterium]
MIYKGVAPEKFAGLMQEKYNRKSFRGLELRNANGDISPNSLSYNYTMDRLSYIRQRVVEQTFYEVLPSNYLDVIPGEGAFAQQIITNATIKTGSNFASGKVNTSGHNNRLATADAAVTPVYTKVTNWAMAIDYNIFDVEQSLFSGNWDIVEMKHRARKKDWDLGIQAVAFLGDLDDLTDFPGLLTQSTVNVNTSLITTNISAMTYTQYNTFVAGVIGAFLSNANQTVYPNMFVIPQDDYAGLAAPINPEFPLISKLSYLQQAFDAIVPNGKVKILPSAYAMSAYNNAAGVNKQRYALYRRDIDTMFMELPVDYQTTMVGTLNNFNFQDAAYGQYCGVTLLKPLEMLYFDHS